MVGKDSYDQSEYLGYGRRVCRVSEILVDDYLGHFDQAQDRERAGLADEHLRDGLSDDPPDLVCWEDSLKLEHCVEVKASWEDRFALVPLKRLDPWALSRPCGLR